ncbi:hypothetical protein PSYMO_38036, partial [Pseudomonas amygdali pv. mori str. 301020]
DIIGLEVGYRLIPLVDRNQVYCVRWSSSRGPSHVL